MPCRWVKLDPNTTQQYPVRLAAEDECYYAREYTKGGSFTSSQGNQDISNFKKDPRYRNTKSWYYKEQAIQKFASEVSELIKGPFHAAAIPTSKKIGDSGYDSRLADTLTGLKFLRPAMTIQSPFVMKESHQPVHLGGARSEKEFYDKLEWVGFRSSPDHIVLIDDVITTGSHFKACQRLILEHHPALRVIGVFWVKVVWPETDLEP